MRKPSQIEKERLHAALFGGPKRCEQCGESVPRREGAYYLLRGAPRWVCHKHMEMTK